MTRQNKLIILAIYLLILAIALPVYRIKRASADKRLQAQITASQREISKIQEVSLEMDRLKRLFPAEAGIAPFIEDLYTAAQHSGLSSHEASTENVPGRPAGRGTTSLDELQRFRFKISVDGSYRSIAEYVRRIQNIERYKRITEIKLTTGANGISGSIALELVALRGPDAR